MAAVDGGPALGRAVHTALVQGDPVAERAQQHGERAVELEAVTAPAQPHDAVDGDEGIDAGAAAELDVERLVRHVLQERAVQPVQRRHARRAGGHAAQPVEERGGLGPAQRGRGGRGGHAVSSATDPAAVSPGRMGPSHSVTARAARIFSIAAPFRRTAQCRRCLQVALA
ncbi:hypothetical protein GCM10020254_86260 [Streptomyces goshikiensis]